MNAQQLKSSILQYAMEGKLVKQNPSDEPVEILLEKIQKEKSNLKIDNNTKKVSSSVSEEEKLFEVPNTWRWVRINDIAIKVTDGSHNPPPNSGTGYQIISAKNITSKGIDFSLSDRFVNEKDFERENKRTNIENGDFLLCIVGSIGKSAIVETDMKFTAQRSVAVLKTLINNYFLKYLLASPIYLSLMESKSAGTAQKGIYLNTIKEIQIPLPPLEEQQRIVDRINDLEKKIDNYNKLYQRNELNNKSFPINLEKSILEYAMQGKLITQSIEDEPASVLLSKIKKEKEELIKKKIVKKEKELPQIREEEIPFEIPGSWTWVRLGDIGTWKAGSTPSRSNSAFYDGDIPWLKTGELNDGYISSSNEFISQEALEKCSLNINKPGAVLIAMYGATIGKLGILEIEATTNQACCACHPFNGVYNKFLFYYLMSARSNFRASAEGGAQPNISRVKVVNTLMPLPPFEEQKQIVTKIEELLAITKTVGKQSLKKEYLVL